MRGIFDGATEVGSAPNRVAPEPCTARATIARSSNRARSFTHPPDRPRYGAGFYPALGSNRAGYSTPAIRAPTIGASQNSQSCSSAHPPTNTAGPVLRAGLTDVLVTGI